MRLLVTEKPSVAASVARALNCGNKHDGYFEGNGYIVTFAYGHLLELKDCKDYDPSMEVWALDKFPFIPINFEYKVRTDPETKQPSKIAVKQLKVIKELVNRADVVEVINACDYDLEGMNIFTNICSFLNVKKPCYRLQLNEWTTNEILSGLRRLIPMSQLRNQQDAGLCRQHADWCLGINFTSVSTLQFTLGNSKGKRPLSIGRIIMPTLKLLYDRDMAIRNFRPQKYYELKAVFNTAKGEYEGLLINGSKSLGGPINTRFDSIDAINKAIIEIKGKTAFVFDKTVKREKENPPLLFNLNDLEGYITSEYSGWTSDKVDKIAQALYEGKGNGGFISYPRTRSRHLEDTPEFIAKVKNVLNILKKGLSYENEIQFHAKSRVFDSSKVDSHGAIIPTYVIPTGLSSDEQLVYDAIVKRFLAQFMPPAEYESTQIITQVVGTPSNRLFVTKDRVLVSEGWQKLYSKTVQKTGLPSVNKGDNASIKSLEPLHKETQPPKHYSEKTLFKAMETCGKHTNGNDNGGGNGQADDGIDDKILTAVLSGYEIGTPATRSETLKKMIDIGYVRRNGKSLLITNMGIRLIEVFPVQELVDLDFTGKLQQALTDIEKGKHTRDEVMQVIKHLTVNGVEQIKQTQGVVADYSDGTDIKVLGVCPECGEDVVESDKGYGCSAWREGCNFVIWKRNAFLVRFGIKQVDKSTVVDLLNSPDGIEIKTRTAVIFTKLIKKDGRYNLEFEVKEQKKVIVGKCPECGSDVVSNKKAFSCSNNDCDFVIWKNDRFLAKFKKKPTETMVKTLLDKGSVFVKGLQSPKAGKGKFDCTLRLEKHGGYWNFKMEFDNANTGSRSAKDSEAVVGRCPECGGDVIESGSVFKCSDFGCGFRLYKNDMFMAKFNKTLTKSIVKKLLRDKRVFIKGFYSKNKKKYFDANVVLQKEGEYWNFKFEF